MMLCAAHLGRRPCGSSSRTQTKITGVWGMGRRDRLNSQRRFRKRAGPHLESYLGKWKAIWDAVFGKWISFCNTEESLTFAVRESSIDHLWNRPALVVFIYFGNLLIVLELGNFLHFDLRNGKNASLHSCTLDWKVLIVYSSNLGGRVTRHSRLGLRVRLSFIIMLNILRKPFQQRKYPLKW